MSRTVYLLGWAFLLVAGAFLLTDALLWRPAVSAANVRRIRLGMTKDEVEDILGVPPNSSYWPAYGWTPSTSASEEIRPPWWAMWWGRAGRATVQFDDLGRVWKATFDPSPAPRPFRPFLSSYHPEEP